MAKNKYAVYVREVKMPLFIEAGSIRDAKKVARTLGYNVGRAFKLNKPRRQS